MTTLNLIVIGKDNIVCFVLVNVVMWLNLIMKPKVQHQRNYILSFTFPTCFDVEFTVLL
jgi:hypothetical protein